MDSRGMESKTYDAVSSGAERWTSWESVEALRCRCRPSFSSSSFALLVAHDQPPQSHTTLSCSIFHHFLLL